MKLKSFSILISAFTFFACEDPNVCLNDEEASSIIYEFPDSIPAAYPHDLMIHYVIENSCGSFLAFDDTAYGNVVEITTMLRYEGCNCALEFVEDSMSYLMQHDTAGTFLYKFSIGETDFDTHAVLVY
ncbi:MAG: hypothetical protein IPO32_08790 [Crocinitomicaceae bacterium]|nr:hypothetical protein [Crocinitomicaceae bacterium]